MSIFPADEGGVSGRVWLRVRVWVRVRVCVVTNHSQYRITHVLVYDHSQIIPIIGSLTSQYRISHQSLPALNHSSPSIGSPANHFRYRTTQVPVTDHPSIISSILSSINHSHYNKITHNSCSRMAHQMFPS